MDRKAGTMKHFLIRKAEKQEPPANPIVPAPRLPPRSPRPLRFASSQTLHLRLLAAKNPQNHSSSATVTQAFLPVLHLRFTSRNSIIPGKIKSRFLTTDFTDFTDFKTVLFLRASAVNSSSFNFLPFNVPRWKFEVQRSPRPSSIRRIKITAEPQRPQMDRKAGTMKHFLIRKAEKQEKTLCFPIVPAPRLPPRSPRPLRFASFKTLHFCAPLPPQP